MRCTFWIDYIDFKTTKISVLRTFGFTVGFSFYKDDGATHLLIDYIDFKTTKVSVRCTFWLLHRFYIYKYSGATHLLVRNIMITVSVYFVFR